MKKVELILLFFITYSCVSINDVLEKYGVFSENAVIKDISNKHKKIVFIEMHHLGRPEFYSDVAHKTDSLQKDGYMVFYESVTVDSSTDSLTIETYKKKFRKISGINSVEYYDTITNKIAGKYQYKGKYKLINQPNYSDLNLNNEKALNVDVTLNTLIDKFEEKYGEIKLNECDKNTAFDAEKYKCKPMDRGLRYVFHLEFIIDYRNEALAKKIINYERQKILVIYGKAHFDGLLKNLQKIDSTWK